jgi:DNA helicase-2/ATP-dependent DNA helicase PcrA
MNFDPTPEQRAVIEYPLQPLRVVAGAGTGKTTTIVHRLAALVANGLSPERALGITFTNKAAEELADRLRAALPELAADGREVEVTTYHGFAYGILQEFGAVLGVERDAEVIGPGYVRQLMQDALSAGRYTYLDVSAVAARVDDAATLNSQLARNLQTVENLNSPSSSDEVEQRRAELAAIIGRYQHHKRTLGVLDYGDLIQLTYQLLTRHGDIANRIKARYSVALLDEYQDTDPAQRELLRTIFKDGFPVTAVGDSDQTIYEWRGASTRNFDDFPTHFPAADGSPAATLPLTENRRSSVAILDAADAVRGAMYENQPYARLQPVAGAGQGNARAAFFRTAVDEAEFIAEEIVRLHTEEDQAWRDVAVVFRKNKDMALVRDALQAQGVPVEVGSLGGLLDLPDVADLHAWLRTIERPGDSIALARILLGPGYRLGLADLAPLTSWIKPNRAQLGDDPDSGWPLVEAVDQLEQIAGLSTGARDRLLDFRRKYRRFLEVAQGSSLVDLCRLIIDETAMWNEIEARDPGPALTARVNLYRFLDLAEDWSPIRGRPTLQAFLGYLDLIADEKSASELDTANVGAEDAVVLLTIHRAKGLEWDTVFVPSLTEGVFPVTQGTFDDPYLRAQFLPYALRLETPIPIGLDARERKSELRRVRNRQEWRAAYVGITRAKTRLYLTGAHWHGGGKTARQPSPIFEAAGTAGSVAVDIVAGGPGPRPESLAVVSNLDAPDPLFPEGWRHAMQQTLRDTTWPAQHAADYSYDAAVDQIRLILDDMPEPPHPEAESITVDTSVTGLVTLASCPLRYFWSEVDPLPRRQAPAMKRGIRIHRLIELHGRGEMPLEEMGDDLYDIPDWEESSGPELDPYQVYLKSRFAELRPRYVETPIDLELAAGRIRGRIDAVYEQSPGEWEIVDFKSGRPGNDPSALVQLEAYAIAAHEGTLSPDPPNSLAVTFAYLGGGELNEVTEQVDSNWLEVAGDHLNTLLAAAAGPEYPPTPSPACLRCDFGRFCDAGRAYLESQ